MNATANERVEIESVIFHSVVNWVLVVVVVNF